MTTTKPGSAWPFQPNADERTDYVYEPERRIKVAVNVALVARRPLLVTGPPGSGKSALAAAIALDLGLPLLTRVITSRTELADLTATYDHVRRLADAQARAVAKVRDYQAYLEPGVLWEAFDPSSIPASRRPNGGGPETATEAEPADGAVVLLDEIDKADPDLPDDLLGPLDTMSFAKPAAAGSGDVTVPEGRQVLIVLTDNRERDLSAAFRRRCVELSLEPASDGLLRRVAAVRFGATAEVAALAEVVIAAMGEIAAARDEEPDDGRPAPSTAEFVNTVEACIELGIPADKADGYFQEILSVALAKGRGFGPDAVPAED